MHYPKLLYKGAGEGPKQQKHVHDEAEEADALKHGWRLKKFAKGQKKYPDVADDDAGGSTKGAKVPGVGGMSVKQAVALVQATEAMADLNAFAGEESAREGGSRAQVVKAIATQRKKLQA